MKQLLVITAAAPKKDASGNAISGPKLANQMAPGSIGFVAQNEPDAWADSAIKTDFWIYYRSGNGPVSVFEVDKESLQVMKTPYFGGAKPVYTVTIPTVAPGNTYTVVLVKKGKVPHERNTWTATESVFIDDNTTDADDIAEKLANYFLAMVETGSLDVSVSVSSNVITITGLKYNEDFVVLAGDDLPKTAIANTTKFAQRVGDKAYVEELASKCAAGRGFTDTYRDGDTIYPGYPIEVPDTNYNIYTLRFATNRKASKTRDERVHQLIHIAVPVEATNSGDTSAAWYTYIETALASAHTQAKALLISANNIAINQQQGNG